MKLTNKQLNEMVYEEIQSMVDEGVIDEGVFGRMKARGAGLGARVKAGFKGARQKLGGTLAGGEEGAALRQKGAATAAAGKTAAQQAKVRSILGSSLKELKNSENCQFAVLCTEYI